MIGWVLNFKKLQHDLVTNYYLFYLLLNQWSFTLKAVVKFSQLHNSTYH